jgi:hypothetical protein
LENVLNRPLNRSGNISILDTNNKSALIVTGKEPIKQGSSDIAHMRVAGGTRGIANSNRLIYISHRSLAILIL